MPDMRTTLWPCHGLVEAGNPARVGLLPHHSEWLHRIMSQPAYPGALPTSSVAGRLAEAANGPDHAFWPDDVNLLGNDAVDWTRVLGHRQVTDTYLLALAVRHGGRFVTFDRRIAVKAIQNARSEHLTVLG